MKHGHRRTLALVIGFVLAACSSSGTKGGGGDDQAAPDAPNHAAIDAPNHTAVDAPRDGASICGHVGDVGNDMGVGKYCDNFGDCLGNGAASLCAVLGDPDAHFCTKTCDMGSTNQCGTNATCTCNASNQCGCTPNSCLGM
jgi:hypothetical protein